MALIYSAYNCLLLDWAKVRYPSFQRENKRGKLVSLPLFVLKHISRWLLGFWHQHGVEVGLNTMFAIRLLSLFSKEFELPFLKGSHQLGTTTGMQYSTFLKPTRFWHGN